MDTTPHMSILVGTLAFILVFLSADAFATVAPLPVLNQKPSLKASNVYVKPTQSVLSLPLAIPLTQIKSEAEKHLPETLHTIDERRNVGCVDLLVTKRCFEVDLSGWVKRNGKLNVEGKDAELIFHLPLRASITAKGVGEVSQHLAETGQGALTVTLKATVGVTNNWQTKVNITPDYVWDEPFYVEVAGMKISLQSQADVAVTAELERIATQLQKQMVQLIDLKKVANNAWQQLQQPQLLNPRHGLWLKIEPRNTFIEYIGVKNQVFNLHAGVSGSTQAMLARPRVTTRAALPKLSRAPKHKAVELTLPMTFDYEQIAEQLAWRLNDEFTVDEMTIYPHRGALVLAISLTDEQVSGVVHIVGHPVLDAEKKRMSLKSLSYTRAFELVFWQQEHTALRERLLQVIESVAYYDYGNMLLLSKARFNEALSNYRTEHIHVSGEVEAITPERLVTADNGLVIITHIKGRLAAAISGR